MDGEDLDLQVAVVDLLSPEVSWVLGQVDRDDLAFPGQTAQSVDGQTGGGLGLGHGQGVPDEALELVQVGLCAQDPGVQACGGDLLLGVQVVLVRELAHELLREVFHCEHADEAAELVHDARHLLP